MTKKVLIYDISWNIDMGYILSVHSHSGKGLSLLGSNAEDERKELPSKMFLEVEEDADLDDLYWLIEREAGAFYCTCGGYELED